MKSILKTLLLIGLFLLSTVSYWEKNGRPFGKYYFFVAESSSMKPAFNKGDIVISAKSENITVGDIVTFKYPLNMSRNITHRVVETGDEEGKYYITKGDNNSTVDPWHLRDDLIVGKAKLIIPFLGFAVNVVRNPYGLLLTVIIPLGVLIAWESGKIYSAGLGIVSDVKRYTARKLIWKKARHAGSGKDRELKDYGSGFGAGLK